MTNDRVVSVFGASLPSADEYQDAVRMGSLLASAGYSVANGGYGGVMEAVSKGASEAGGHVIGVIAPDAFPDRSSTNSYLDETIETPSLPERLAHLVVVADAAVALAPSAGTLAELVVTWNDAHVHVKGGMTPRPLIAVGKQWRDLVDDLAKGFGLPSDLVSSVSTVEEAAIEVDRLLNPQTTSAPEIA